MASCLKICHPLSKIKSKRFSRYRRTIVIIPTFLQWRDIYDEFFTSMMSSLRGQSVTITWKHFNLNSAFFIQFFELDESLQWNFNVKSNWINDFVYYSRIYISPIHNNEFIIQIKSVLHQIIFFSIFVRLDFALAIDFICAKIKSFVNMTMKSD